MATSDSATLLPTTLGDNVTGVRFIRCDNEDRPLGGYIKRDNTPLVLSATQTLTPQQMADLPPFVQITTGAGVAVITLPALNTCYNLIGKRVTFFTREALAHQLVFPAGLIGPTIVSIAFPNDGRAGVTLDFYANGTTVGATSSVLNIGTYVYA